MFSATILALIKTTGSLALLGAALIKLIEDEQIRQSGTIQLLGTLECEIENRRLIGQDYVILRERHDQLIRLLNRKEVIV